jgi:hypothetical protein
MWGRKMISAQLGRPHLPPGQRMELYCLPCPRLLDVLRTNTEQVRAWGRPAGAPQVVLLSVGVPAGGGRGLVAGEVGARGGDGAVGSRGRGSQDFG